MSALDNDFWGRRQYRPNSSHYEDWWLDTYALIVRFAALWRIWPSGVHAVIDVGCGDGRFGSMIRKFMRIPVNGLDVFPNFDAMMRLNTFFHGPIEKYPISGSGGTEVLAVLMATSLTFMADPLSALKAAHKHAKYLIVIENTQTPTPLWMEDLSYRKHLELYGLMELVTSAGYFPWSVIAVNVLDRSLFIEKPWIPKPIAFVVTLLYDLFMAPRTAPEYARYTACLFERK